VNPGCFVLPGLKSTMLAFRARFFAVVSIAFAGWRSPSNRKVRFFGGKLRERQGATPVVPSGIGEFFPDRCYPSISECEKEKRWFQSPLCGAGMESVGLDLGRL
jgi:hypothetical protein